MNICGPYGHSLDVFAWSTSDGEETRILMGLHVKDLNNLSIPNVHASMAKLSIRKRRVYFESFICFWTPTNLTFYYQSITICNLFDRLRGSRSLKLILLRIWTRLNSIQVVIHDIKNDSLLQYHCFGAHTSLKIC